jgi:hypothetical protein
MDCAGQLSTGIYAFITSYDHARFPVIDVERQVVFGHWAFRRMVVAGVTLEGKFYPFQESMRFPNENLLARRSSSATAGSRGFRACSERQRLQVGHRLGLKLPEHSGGGFACSRNWASRASTGQPSKRPPP